MLDQQLRLEVDNKRSFTRRKQHFKVHSFN